MHDDYYTRRAARQERWVLTVRVMHPQLASEPSYAIIMIIVIMMIITIIIMIVMIAMISIILI